MRVLISGYYGYHNVGDEAILQSIIRALKEENPEIEIVVLSNDVEYTKKTYGVDAINRWSINDIFKNLKNSDGLISGGGSLLQDATSNRAVKYYIGIMAICNFVKKPFFIYAQGIGPINNNLNKKLTKKYLQKAKFISLRDDESKDFVKSLGVKNDIEIVPDPVMGFDINDFSSKLCDEYNKPYVTISVREWKNAKQDFLKKVKDTCDLLIENGYEVVFIPMHGINDYNVSKNIVDKMKNKACIFKYDASIEEKIFCIKNSNLIIGMRLHALIFSATVNTPMIGISYDPKIDSFLSQVSQPCIGSVDCNWTSDDLFNLSFNILKNYDEEVEKLSKYSEKLKKEAKLTAKKIINILG